MQIKKMHNLELTFNECMQLDADLNIRTDSDQLPLHLACRYGSY